MLFTLTSKRINYMKKKLLTKIYDKITDTIFLIIQWSIGLFIFWIMCLMASHYTIK